MSSNHNEPTEPADIIIHPKPDLVSLPVGGSPALSEIINRSLVHIQTSKTLAVPVWRAGEEQEFEIAHGVKVVMCWIPPGEFLMGSPEDEVGGLDNETQHRVTITQGFWLGKYPITQSQWRAVMGSNPSYFKGSNFPVECVSWNDISKAGGFIDKVNRYTAAEGILSLPTEAQWEYACRSGTVTALNNSKNLTAPTGACSDLDEVAWYSANSGYSTHPVGQKKANAWGLHDMHGNVGEWCLDWCEDYEDSAQVNPRGPESGSGRVVRGGSWGYDAFSCRASYRHCADTGGNGYFFGFRLAQSSAPKIVSGENERTDSMEQVTNTVHVVTSKNLSKLHRIGDHELQSPDYQLVCSWAVQLNILPLDVLMALLDHSSDQMDALRTTILDGHFINLVADLRLLGIIGLPKIDGLQIEKLKIDSLDLCVLDLSSVPNLNLLSCNHNQLSDLDLLPVPKLKMLICSGNKLTGLDLSPVPMLRWLICGINPLTDLDLSPVPKLEGLHCGGNLLSELDLSPVTNLRDLDCSANELLELDLTPVPNLTSLSCMENLLTELDLSSALNLTELNCDNNQLTNIDLSKVLNLTNLSCDGNQLTILDFSQLTKLEEFYCCDNKLSDLHFPKICSLTLLSCHNNKLSTLKFSQASNLDSLGCSNNQLNDLELFRFPNLTQLSCAKNKIPELDLSCVPNLSWLNCRENHLTKLDLPYVPNLSVLDCSENQLSILDICYLRNLQTLFYDEGDTLILQRPDQNF